MNIEKKKVVQGENVKILKKDGGESTGMVRSILKDFDGEVIVELFNGAIGKVTRVIPRTLPLRASRTSLSALQREVEKSASLSIQAVLSGEKKNLEYKKSALWSQNLSREEIDRMPTPEVKKFGQRASKVILAKVIAGFMNSSGGHLLIGIQEGKTKGSENKVVGIDEEFSELRNKDYSEDGYRRMIMDDVIRPFFPKEIFNQFDKYFQISFSKIHGKTICSIGVKKSESEVFISIGNEDYFFVRVDTQTRELRGKEIVDYVRRQFG